MTQRDLVAELQAGRRRFLALVADLRPDDRLDRRRRGRRAGHAGAGLLRAVGAGRAAAAPAVAVPDRAQPRDFVELVWAVGAIVEIHDFRYVSYIVHDADIILAPGDRT
jgi:hypothetical protein